MFYFAEKASKARTIFREFFLDRCGIGEMYSYEGIKVIESMCGEQPGPACKEFNSSRTKNARRSSGETALSRRAICLEATAEGLLPMMRGDIGPCHREAREANA